MELGRGCVCQAGSHAHRHQRGGSAIIEPLPGMVTAVLPPALSSISNLKGTLSPSDPACCMLAADPNPLPPGGSAGRTVKREGEPRRIGSAPAFSLQQTRS